MGMGEQPWNLFPNEEEKRGSGAQHPRAGNDPSTWSARSKQPSAWNDDRTPVTVGSNLASSAGPMAPQTSDPRVSHNVEITFWSALAQIGSDKVP